MAREFEPSSQAIGDWVRKADAEEGHLTGVLTQDEREELRRLRKENKRLRTEREILAKAAAWCDDRLNPASTLRHWPIKASASSIAAAMVSYFTCPRETTSDSLPSVFLKPWLLY